MEILRLKLLAMTIGAYLKISLLLLIITINLGCDSTTAPQHTEEKIMEKFVDIEVQEIGSPEYSLNIKLTNRSAQPLTVYQHSLPWVGWHSMLLIAVKADATGSVIEHSLLIDDPGAQTVTIAPDQTLTGGISLANHFPGLAEALKNRDVVVFWSYQLQPIGAAPLKRTGGCLVFPKLTESKNN